MGEGGTNLNMDLTRMHAYYWIHRMQAILEQLTEKIESFDSQLQSLALSRSKPHDSDHDMVNYHQSPDQPAPGPASDEESNQDYLKSLNEIKVGDHTCRLHIIMISILPVLVFIYTAHASTLTVNVNVNINI